MKIEKKDKQTQFQKLEQEYAIKTSKGKRNFLLVIVWGLVFAFIFNLDKVNQLATLIAIIIGIVISIIIWFDILPIARYLLKLFCFLGNLEEFPEYLNEKLQKIIPWFYVRKCVALLLAVLFVVLGVGLICFILAFLF